MWLKMLMSSDGTRRGSGASLWPIASAAAVLGGAGLACLWFGLPGVLLIAALVLVEALVLLPPRASVQTKARGNAAPVSSPAARGTAQSPPQIFHSGHFAASAGAKPLAQPDILAKPAQPRAPPLAQNSAPTTGGDIVFQPQLSTDTGEVVGLEAILLAVYCPSPDDLSDAAPTETKNLTAGPLDCMGRASPDAIEATQNARLVTKALEAILACNDAGLAIGSVTIALSAARLQDSRLPDHISWELDRLALSPERLTLALPLSVLCARSRPKALHRLTELGVSLDLFDARSPHPPSPLLRGVELRRLWLGRDLTQGIESDPAKQRQLVAFLAYSEARGLPTLASCVETRAEHAILSQLGCHQVQGPAIAPFLPLDELLRWQAMHASCLRPSRELARQIVP